MALTTRERMVRSYTMAVFIDGTRSFDGHNGTPAVNAGYHEELKTCAAGLLAQDQIDAALVANRITEAEFGDTVAKIGTPAAESWKTK